MRYKGVLLLFFVLFAAMTGRAQYLHQPGDKALDFEGVTVNGETYHLYDTQAERVILCFWAVDCDYCHDFLKSLRRHRCRLKGYELVTFVLADNPDEVRKEAKKLRLHGYHFFDPAGWNSAPFLDYDINITPTVILLDKDKNIIGEAYDWDEFKALITHE
ncbi:MAG: peroxiredoxin family protein [Bacteroidales bacterium]|nr:peroxiredoxin family protein [Bacteroidales bacterium]